MKFKTYSKLQKISRRLQNKQLGRMQVQKIKEKEIERLMAQLITK